MQFLSDHWLILLISWPLWAPMSMLIWYAIGIQYERGGLWRVLLPYTLFQLYFWEIAPKGEFTISMRLGRLIEDPGWRGAVSRWLAVILNWLAPKRHI